LKQRTIARGRRGGKKVKKHCASLSTRLKNVWILYNPQDIWAMSNLLRKTFTLKLLR